jgi:hypothetical protein
MNIKQKGGTLFLRLTLIAIALLSVMFCFFAFPEIWRSYDFEDQMLAQPMRGVIVRWYISVIPFLIGLWQSWKLLTYIDRGVAFSELSTRALSRIKKCAVIIAFVMASALPFFFGFAEIDDAPGVVIVGMMFVGGPVAVAIFASVLQKLLRNAIDMKNENELTV